MSGITEEALRRQLQGELTALPVPVAPVAGVTRRGRALRVRRWAAASAAAATAAAVAAVVLALPGLPPERVTVSPADGRAPGGVFASGTAGGRDWQLAVRNLAGQRPWCEPAVMLNGRDGDVLFRAPRLAALGNPAFLVPAPGFPGAGFGFVQVPPQVSRVAVRLPGGILKVTPVPVTACGQHFRLAGFAFAHPRRGVTALTAFSGSGPEESLPVPSGVFTAGTTGTGTFSPGVWQNLDKSRPDVAASTAATRIGSGRAAGTRWEIRRALGLYGECYQGTVARHRGAGAASACMPVQAVPPSVALTWVPFPAIQSVGGGGLAGPVSPRAARVVVRFGNGTSRTLTPVLAGGRKYIAFAIPQGTVVRSLSVTGPSGRTIATFAGVPIRPGRWWRPAG